MDKVSHTTNDFFKHAAFSFSTISLSFSLFTPLLAHNISILMESNKVFTSYLDSSSDPSSLSPEKKAMRGTAGVEIRIRYTDTGMGKFPTLRPDQRPVESYKDHVGRLSQLSAFRRQTKRYERTNIERTRNQGKVFEWWQDRS